MSTTTIPPMHVPLTADHERPVEKITARLSPSTPHILLDKDDTDDACPLTFIVDLKSDSVQSPHAKERKEAAVTGEQTPGFDSPLSSPHESPEELSRVDVDGAKPPTPEPNDSDSEAARSPIDPPGLSEQIPRSAPDQPEGESISVENPVEVVGRPVQPPIADAPEELDAIFSIDLGVFKWKIGPTLFNHDLSDYSLSGLSPLDTFIPDQLLPGELFVHDINNITRVHPRDTDEYSAVRRTPVRYVRICPEAQHESQFALSARNADKAVAAHLYLRSSNRLGSGHHSYVYRAPFNLQLDPASPERSTVTVAVKTANQECGAHLMLNKEAMAYSMFPRELMEDTFRVPPAKDGISSTDGAASAASPDASTTSTSAVESESISDSHDANCLGPPPRPAPPAETPADETQVGEWEPAIVPKFYGYYGAVKADGSLYDGRHRHCDEDDECSVNWPTRILLVEECGSPIEPRDLPRNEREKVFQLIKRLHKAGFMNGSTYPRNMLSQPGPLSVPRKERSDASASYRIIDFGRSSVLSLLPEGRHHSFEAWCEEEVERAMRYLLL